MELVEDARPPAERLVDKVELVQLSFSERLNHPAVSPGTIDKTDLAEKMLQTVHEEKFEKSSRICPQAQDEWNTVPFCGKLCVNNITDTHSLIQQCLRIPGMFKDMEQAAFGKLFRLERQTGPVKV